ncbi:PDDEXK nuclease domain-containing protein [Pseudarthrobacter sp. NS4]|uniref:PDDEXK nuclease domain-containing protein n=1 Tax=Pseudarthrobacter sp. NS4 TaxID=2973976 RepID=UPI0028680386|nr:PDDEXK nuclease domain-containing protein [Pseudarthrobacter sp. NS4]
MRNSLLRTTPSSHNRSPKTLQIRVPRPTSTLRFRRRRLVHRPALLPRRTTRLHRLELKKFQPEYTGKLNFYIALVDDRLRREAHAETVGILICGSKNDHTFRYSVGRATPPMAVASYTYDALPPDLQHELPDPESLTAALD